MRDDPRANPIAHRDGTLLGQGIPEVRLWLRVIREAQVDAARGVKHAQKWLMSPQFEGLCSCIGLDPGAVRDPEWNIR